MIFVYDEIICDYHRWLVSLVDNDYHELEAYYTKLMWILDDIPYKWHLKSDENRYDDGLKMRALYDERINLTDISLENDVIFGKEPSILEVLVALFTRYSDDIVVGPWGKSVAPRLFYEFLGNFGLKSCDDSGSFSEKSGNFEPEVRAKMEEFMEKSGKKCLFSGFCQKSAGLWEQCGTLISRAFLDFEE